MVARKGFKQFPWLYQNLEGAKWGSATGCRAINFLSFGITTAATTNPECHQLGYSPPS